MLLAKPARVASNSACTLSRISVAGVITRSTLSITSDMRPGGRVYSANSCTSATEGRSACSAAWAKLLVSTEFSSTAASL